MSKTDKTNPTWVKLMQNPQWRKERHYHFSRECDIEIHNWPRRYTRSRCFYWPTSNVSDKFYSRTKWVQYYRDKHQASERARLRLQLTEMKRMTREEIYDCEFGSYQHRHSAIWDAF